MQTYKKYKDEINPDNLPRGKMRGFYQIDHKFSVVKGFEENIPVEIISSKFNLEMVSFEHNSSKRTRCSITKNELYELYQNST